MDRLTAFRTFLAVVDEGGFAAAARALGISNAAASAHVRELEDRLGSRLLSRTSRRVALTEAGVVYRERVAAILADLEAADEAVATLADEPRGTLRVTAPMSFGLLEITPRVPAFLDRHPRVRLDLKLDDAALDVVGGGFDLAVRGHGALPDSSLVSRRLAALPICLCASPAYLEGREPPATPEDLADHPCLLYTHAARPGRWTLVRGEERRTVRVDGPYAVNNSLAIRDALLAGAGVASIPRRYVADDLASGRLRTVLDDWKPEAQAVHALWASGPYPSLAVRAFVAFLAGALTTSLC